ncbi:hypothetical protein [Methylomonas sp. TEB]|uniref:hypothetical protein n=1 Tax=Methylomonas sp. TEB TaxID=3398229 RepID=UPI0039F4CAC4
MPSLQKVLRFAVNAFGLAARLFFANSKLSKNCSEVVNLGGLSVWGFEKINKIIFLQLLTLMRMVEPRSAPLRNRMSKMRDLAYFV